MESEPGTPIKLHSRLRDSSVVLALMAKDSFFAPSLPMQFKPKLSAFNDVLTLINSASIDASVSFRLFNSRSS